MANLGRPQRVQVLALAKDSKVTTRRRDAGGVFVRDHTLQRLHARHQSRETRLPHDEGRTSRCTEEHLHCGKLTMAR